LFDADLHHFCDELRERIKNKTNKKIEAISSDSETELPQPPAKKASNPIRAGDHLTKAPWRSKQKVVGEASSGSGVQKAQAQPDLEDPLGGMMCKALRLIYE